VTRRNIEGCRAVVTGASSGIGRALARRLAREGARLVLTARRADRLVELVAEIDDHKGEACAVAGDITDPAIRAKVLETAATTYGGLDLLVNNAGVGATGLFEVANPQRVRRIMEVNFFALVEMTRAALPLLKQGTRPMLVNIGSIVGHRGVPHNSEYSASKFAVRGFSEAIRAEWAREGIDVLVVSPGTTDTEFFERVIEQTTAPAWPEHKAVSADMVARQILRAIRLGRHEIIPYRWGKVMVWLNRFSPRLMDRIMTRYV
jgi:short-subunit dehydrogenase